MKEDKKIDLKIDKDNAQLLKDSKNYKKGFKKFVQKIGSFMAGMIMPSVSILIAWGLLAAMFLRGTVDGKEVATGWFDVPSIAQLIGPGMKYLIPILIGYTAGNMIYGVRGGAFGAFLTLAAIEGNDWIYKNVLNNVLEKGVTAPNQIVATMTIVPFGVWVYQSIEKLYINKVKAGYEMLVRNFSLALWVLVIAAAIFYSWGFVMFGVSYVMTSIIKFFTLYKWAFPFMALFTEPLRAIFLNNALNFGVMVPLGTQEVESLGFSKFFMVGGNPGPGFGLLIAYTAWRKKQRAAAGGASAIQLIGGIHEVHYVYILAEPIMVLATIGGAFTSLLIVALFQGGSVAVISPGSLISVISMSGTGYRIGINVAAVFAGAAVSFGIASFIMIFKRKHGGDQMEVNVSDEGITFGDDETKKVSSNLIDNNPNNFDFSKAKLLMVACDAGMGSSAMAAGILRKWVKQNEIYLEVRNCAVKDIPADVDILVTMNNFVDFAREKIPNSYIFGVKQFLGKDVFKPLQDKLLENKKIKKEE